MTAKLNLRLHKFLGGASTEVGAVAQIYAIDEAGQRDYARDQRDVLIPAGYEADPRIVDVEPGTYLVEAMLPSGDVASSQVTLANGASLNVDLVASHSPHEWLSWQQYVGNVPPRPDPASKQRVVRTSPARKAATQVERVDRYVEAVDLAEGPEGTRYVPARSGSARSRVVVGADCRAGGGRATRAVRSGPAIRTTAPGNASARRVAASAPPSAWPATWFIGEPVEELSGGNGGAAAAWALVVDDATQEDPLNALAGGKPTAVAYRVRDDVREILTIGTDGPITDDKRDPGRGDVTPRRYLLATRPRGPAELACLPLPWESGTNERAPIEVLVRRNPLPGEATIAMSPLDPRIGSALGFMGTGNLENARLVFDRAKDLLFGKGISPLGAAAGGYVLLATEHGPGEHEWHGWISNLANGFTWLPDGMIQYGRLRLLRRQDESDVTEARAALFQAYDRGLPYYSLGLQWLADGLALLASRDDEDARRRLASVQEVVWRANLTQPFTTIRVRD